MPSQSPPPLSPTTTRVLLVDDHAVLRDGLAALLNATPNLRVVADAGDGVEALAALERTPVDVAVVDVSMPKMNGIEFTERVRSRWPDLQVVMLSANGSPEFVHRALRAGAIAYVVKESRSHELLEAIAAAGARQRYLSPVLRENLIDHMLGQNTPSPVERLSARERQVLQYLVEGHTSRAIGEQLSLSPKSVETYRRRLMEKLGIRDIPQLVRFAIEQGISGMTYNRRPRDYT